MMAVKIVVVDRAQLPAGVEFPPLEASKYGWEEYPSLSEEDMPDRCWRADIVVCLSDRICIDRNMLEKMPRLKLLVMAAGPSNRLDQGAAREQGVELLAFPDGRVDDAAAAQELCNRIVAAINHYLRSVDVQGPLR